MPNCNPVTTINENQCIGDSLDIINTNFSTLDSCLRTNFNTLIQNLTAFAQSPATVYTNLSTQFRNLSSLIIS